MKAARYLLLLAGALVSSFIFAQNVSDVAFYQEGKNIVVTYLLDEKADVTVQVSTDGGATYSAPLKHVSGDVGKDITVGAKQIIWDVLAEYDSFTGDNVVFLVQAIDETHKYVDLGLPSGTLWAECNVGANFPEEKGDYFAWGETSPKKIYNDATYTMKQYQVDLDATHDAATANWGENWRTPTAAEQEELNRECTWTWTTFHGKNGYRVTGKNGNSIFLPTTGYRYNKRIEVEQSDGYYWSSSITKDESLFAYILSFGSDDIRSYSKDRRRYGQAIRPVYSPAK